MFQSRLQGFADGGGHYFQYCEDPEDEIGWWAGGTETQKMRDFEITNTFNKTITKYNWP